MTRDQSFVFTAYRQPGDFDDSLNDIHQWYDAT
ncbi:hypothetical protein Q31b_35420 [Novipirellula aureliae]|uniref:Uncharacterized protein n=1 Tax=Novipirellula aureliae TaxID=2527966 RepID=A0A5C6DW95_9BACT|nr:hypothetical protein Q31b_35420 [Novipirellula aureliae]